MFRIFTFSISLLIGLATFAQDTTKGTIKDIDGNVYHTVKIGNQRWMQENLKTTHYSDGTPISEIEDSMKWRDAGISQRAAWCYYDNNVGYNTIYGKLYNWYAVVDARHLCPAGWHVPTDTEFQILREYLGGEQVAGGKMKATTLWEAPNTDADNSSKFTALPAGFRFDSWTFAIFGYTGFFWSSTARIGYNAWGYNINYANSNVYRYSYGESDGLSVRCVGD